MLLWCTAAFAQLKPEADQAQAVIDSITADQALERAVVGIYAMTGNGRTLVDINGDKMLVQNPPMPPLEREELDRVYALPYMRTYHPMYEKYGGIKNCIGNESCSAF